MSRVKRMVELQPLRHSSNETLVSVGHLCEYCQGNGWFWGADERGMGVKETCPRCNGNGEFDAIIKIAWQPTCKENIGDGKYAVEVNK